MKPLPPLKCLPVFVSVCRHLNFTRAANELCLTHSAVSQSIKSLETFFGKKLIERTTRQMQLTDAGERLFLAVDDALTIISRASERELQSDGQVAINVLPTLALKWLIPKLPRFKQLQPEIDLRLSTQTFTDSRALQNNIDLALVYGVAPQWPGLVIRPVGQDYLVLVGAPVLGKRPLTDLLANESQIRVSDPLRDYDWLNWLQASGDNLRLNVNSINFQSSVQAIQAAIAGLGIFVTHRLFIAEELKNGLLQDLGSQQVETESGYYLIAQEKSWARREVQLCATWLQEQMRVDTLDSYTET
ncbi:LysR substrate-binding domain-containing protein [Aeromonas salmonicida]|uniref:LysR substrate-binding domain-containing protein n=1 Tax=Aeromonas salmonicida TaxID=645 RepID=UPI003D194E15